jgi:sec-independent protein translocase protein TatA
MTELVLGLTWWQIVLLILLALLLFGSRKLPDIARSVGRSMKEFKKAVKEVDPTSEFSDSEHNKEPVRVVDNGSSKKEVHTYDEGEDRAIQAIRNNSSLSDEQKEQLISDIKKTS